MILMASKVAKQKHIPVDEWDTETNPISDADRIFRSVRGEVILPISEFFCRGSEEYKQLDYFAMNSKRSYNSEETRNHICRYLNYFEKYYDPERELLMVIYELKLLMDYNKAYKKSNFMDDINRYIIRNKSLSRKIEQFVNDNYLMKLSSNNNKTPNLQFEDRHAKILYEISLMMNMYIPLATHYMYIHFIKQSQDIQDFMLELFDMCNTKYEEECGIDIYSKLYETATSVVNKSKNPDKLLWDKNAIRGINTTIHTNDSVVDVILQIMPKYSYNANIINFNYYSNRQCLKFKITDISYEYPFYKLSSSKRDADQNSEYDKFEARLNKKDGALYLQNKVAAQQTVRKIEMLYGGPYSDAEIEHYRKRLIKDGKPIVNSFQKQMVGYLFYKEFGDPITMKAINQVEYIKLLIAGKRLLLSSGMLILPYIISSRVTRVAGRKNLGKKETERFENSKLINFIKQKYNNPKLEKAIMEILCKLVSSTFEIIDFNSDTGEPTEYDGLTVPIINDLVDEELAFFICMI